MKKQKQAFTLVELIVVITILAILGTIAFISLQGYSSNSRDSVRISDISSLKTTLELLNLEAGKYPIPTNGVDITYSGAVVWNQGTFGKTVFTNVSKLDKIPLDPTTDKEYTYSVNSNRYEYQLGGIVEGDVVVMNNPPLTPPYQGVGLVQQTNAGETTATAYITGNYNGLMTKSNSGTTCNVLSIPSIITNDTSVTDLQQIVTNNSFVYRGYKNLPASFKTSKFKYNGGFAFTPNNLIAYTDTGSCTELTSTTNSTARVNLLKGLQDAYSGTTLKNEGEIKNIVGLTINTSSPSDDVINYAGNFVNNMLGGSVGLSSSSSSSSSSTSSSGGPVLKTVSNCLTTKEVLYGSSDSSSGSLTCANDIIVCNGTTGSGYTIAACNAGATSVYTNQTFSGSTAVRNSTVNSWAGGLYQLGNNADNSYTATDTVQIGATTSYSTYSNPTFIIGFTNWTSISNPNLWGLNGKGPCPTNYHVPSIQEWSGLIAAGDGGINTWNTLGSTSGDELKNALKIPMAGIRHQTAGSMIQQISSGTYWSTSLSGSYGYVMSFSSTIINYGGVGSMATGASVRCFKN